MSMRASPQGLKVLDRARKQRHWTKADPHWIEAAYTSEGTLRRFWRRDPIKHETFQQICKAVNVDWQEVVEQTKELRPDPNFIGREDAIRDLKQLIARGVKAILIQGEGGIGKTTLARYYFETHGFKLVLKLHLAMERENIISVQFAIEEWLRSYFEQEPGREFGITLERLRYKLQNSQQKIGILIDGLESALQNGRFVSQHRRYAELLRMLVSPSLNSMTLITSREQLSEPSVLIEPYRLAGLNDKAWQKFFSDRQIEVDAIALREMHDAYGGNAAVMCILTHDIRLNFKRNLQAYWQQNRHDLLLAPTLDNLIEGQFNKLQHDNFSAYRLLCRLGYYRYQEIPTLPKAALLALLWDVPILHDRNSAIKALCDRALMSWHNERYFLHPVMQTKARERLQKEISLEEVGTETPPFNEWSRTNRAAAKFYLAEAKKVEPKASLKYVFEAIDHLATIGDFETCGNVLLFQVLAADKIENLRGSANLWNNRSRIMAIGERICDRISGLQKALLLIPLGTISSEVGKSSQALDISDRILTITSKNITDSSPDSIEQINFARISAYSIAGKAYRYIGDLHKAEFACKEAYRIALESGQDYWKAIAVYGLGAVYLENDKPRKALRHFFAAAAFAKFGGIPQKLRGEIKKIFRLLFYPNTDKLSDVQTFLEKYNQNKQEDRIKKFNILWNVARCFNLMRSSELAKRILDLAEELLEIEDITQYSLLNVELANYYITKKQKKSARECYENALEFSLHQGEWSRAYPLQHYAHFLYEQGEYSEALKKYQELERLLQKTEFRSMQVYNYCYLALTILGLNPQQQQEAEKYLEQARTIATKFEIAIPFDL